MAGSLVIVRYALDIVREASVELVSDELVAASVDAADVVALVAELADDVPVLADVEVAPDVEPEPADLPDCEPESLAPVPADSLAEEADEPPCVSPVEEDEPPEPLEIVVADEADSSFAASAYALAGTPLVASTTESSAATTRLPTPPEPVASIAPPLAWGQGPRARRGQVGRRDLRSRKHARQSRRSQPTALASSDED